MYYFGDKLIVYFSGLYRTDHNSLTPLGSLGWICTFYTPAAQKTDFDFVIVITLEITGVSG